jgi:hypothetical protein
MSLGSRAGRWSRGRAIALGLLLAAVASPAPIAAHASAATYEVKLCREGSGGDGIGLTANPATVEIENVERCTTNVPQGFTEGISQQVNGTFGSSARGGVGWDLKAPANTTIKTLTGHLTSALFWDTPELVWSVFNRSRFLDKIELGGAAHQRNQDVQYAIDSNEVLVALNCTLGGGCPLANTPSHSFASLTNMAVTFEDVAAPAIALGAVPSEGIGTVQIPFTATDAGGGVEKVEAFVDGALKGTVIPSNNGRCARPFIFVVPCSLNVGSSISLDTTGITDGFHPLKLVATDVSGQTADALGALEVHNAPVNRERPQLTGTATVGSALTGTPGRWGGLSPAFSFQWLRCEPGVRPGNEAGCSPIPGATRSSYTLSAADVGMRAVVKVTAKNSGGTETAISDPSQPVTSPPQAGGLHRLELTGVSLSRRRFRAGRAGKAGSVLRFSSTAAGTLTIAVASAKKRVGKPIGTLSSPIAAGPGSLRISGRFGRRSLRPGRYRMTLTATDPAGTVTSPLLLGFTILPRSKKH